MNLPGRGHTNVEKHWSRSEYISYVAGFDKNYENSNAIKKTLKRYFFFEKFTRIFWQSKRFLAKTM
jgi:hypothetical protein